MELSKVRYPPRGQLPLLLRLPNAGPSARPISREGRHPKPSTPGDIGIGAERAERQVSATTRSSRWYGRPGSNRNEPYGPTNFHTTSAFAGVRPPRSSTFVVWTIPSPWPEGYRRPRLVSTPSQVFPSPGLARDSHLTGFPEFERFYVWGFPGSLEAEAQVYQFRHARVTAGIATAGGPPPTGITRPRKRA